MDALTDTEKRIIDLATKGSNASDIARELCMPIYQVAKIAQSAVQKQAGEAENLSQLFRSADLDAKFRSVVIKAMERAGVISLDQKEEFLKWAVGKDYPTLEYQFWPYRVIANARIIIAPQAYARLPIMALIQTAAEIWKRKRLVFGVN